MHRRRGYEKRRRAAETAQQREARLARRRLCDRAHRAAQSTAEDREVGFQQQRLASETQEHRAARLLQASYNQRQRLASETQEERAARLLQASAFSN